MTNNEPNIKMPELPKPAFKHHSLGTLYTEDQLISYAITFNAPGVYAAGKVEALLSALDQWFLHHSAEAHDRVYAARAALVEKEH